MVGHQVLVLSIGVRIPVPEPRKIKQKSIQMNAFLFARVVRPDDYDGFERWCYNRIRANILAVGRADPPAKIFALTKQF